jgi:two-component sensor histidine kinase
MTEVANLSEARQMAQDLLQESHHRIANQLSLLVALIQRHSAALKHGPAFLSQEAAGNILTEMAARVVSVAHLHRRLVDVPENDSINLSSLLIENCVELTAALSLGERVRFRHALDSSCPVTAEQASVLSLLVSEIVMNALKYAHPTGLPVEMSVTCSVTRDGRSCVEISDDGVGLPEGFDERRSGGAGFRIIRSLAAKLGADLTVQSDDLGLSFLILLPAEASAANVIAIQPHLAAVHGAA